MKQKSIFNDGNIIVGVFSFIPMLLALMIFFSVNPPEYTILPIVYVFGAFGVLNLYAGIDTIMQRRKKRKKK